jgi:hypothetical protein
MNDRLKNRTLATKRTGRGEGNFLKEPCSFLVYNSLLNKFNDGYIL